MLFSYTAGTNHLTSYSTYCRLFGEIKNLSTSKKCGETNAKTVKKFDYQSQIS